MASSTKEEKRPRGRKPMGAVLVDGRWQLTEESLHMAAERMLKNREHNRKRYHELRDLLRIEHPELFATRGDPRQTLLTDDVPRSKERVFDLTFYQKTTAAAPAYPSLCEPERRPRAPHVQS